MTVVQIIGLIVVLLLAVISGFLIVKKSKSHDLIKWVGLFAFLSIAMTWIFEQSQGFIYSAEFVGMGLNPQGISDIPYIIYYLVQLCGDKIIFLISLGLFYGIVSKTKGYNKLVSTIAEKFKGKEILFALISSFLITAMTTLFNETFAVLVFVPFIISIALSMKLDKLSAFVISFGSILVGLLGLTYGGEGLNWLNEYLTVSVTDNILYRLLVLGIAFILFNFFTILHIKKVLNKKNVNEIEADPFKVEKVDKKAHVVLAAIGMAFLFVIVVLGFVSWKNIFGLTIFDDFQTWLVGIKIKDFAIFQSIIGTVATPTVNGMRGAFGTWDLFVMSAILMVASVVVGLIGRIKVDEYLEGCASGIKKMLLPIVLFMGIYMVMTAGYVSLYVPAIINLIGGITKTFNPFVTSLAALISNTLYTDLSLTAFAVAPYFASNFADNINAVHTIFATMYGFVQLCLPTSAVLMIGLSYLKIEYKTWIKYIWIFALGMLVILLVLYTIMTYI